jgi:hypothetical protein
MKRTSVNVTYSIAYFACWIRLIATRQSKP